MPVTCRDNRFGPPDRGHDETDCEARDQNARAGAHRDPAECEQHEQRQSQVECPRPLFRPLPKCANPAAAAYLSQREQDPKCADRDQHRAEHRMPRASRTQDERHRNDSGDVGDCDLRGDDERRRIVEHVKLLERRYEHGGRAAAEHDGIDGRMRDVSEVGRQPARADCRGCDHDGCEGAPAESPNEGRIAQRDAHSRGQHHHCEADLGEKRRRRLIRLQPIEAGSAEHESGKELADDNRHQNATARAEQWPGQAGQHDHGEDPEAHSPYSLTGVGGIDPPPVGLGGEQQPTRGGLNAARDQG
jgi:hypothetical protein